MLTRHLAYWLDVLQDLVPHRQPRIELSVFGNPVIAERLTDTIRPALADRPPLLADERRRIHRLDRSTGQRRQGTLPRLLHRHRAAEQPGRPV
jgi:hypothetical protein